MHTVAILCGGEGPRMRASGERLPKPLVEVGGRPILWEVTCLDTGLDTPTGGRVVRAGDALLAGGAFCLTYADGLADVDLGPYASSIATREGRRRSPSSARGSPWGIARLSSTEEGRVEGLVEKPRLENWVNAGFTILEPRALDFVSSEEALEGEPLERLAAAGELAGFRHEGFWASMDTFKDTLFLNELWARGEAPWRALVEV